MAAERVHGDPRFFRPYSMALTWSGLAPTRYTTRGRVDLKRKQHRGRGRITYFVSVAGYLSRVRPVPGSETPVSVRHRGRTGTSSKKSRSTDVALTGDPAETLAAEAVTSAQPQTDRDLGAPLRSTSQRPSEKTRRQYVPGAAVTHEAAFKWLEAATRSRPAWRGAIADLEDNFIKWFSEESVRPTSQSTTLSDNTLSKGRREITGATI